MKKPILIVGGVSVDTIIHLDSFPDPIPQTLWPRESYRCVGGTGAGKALNMSALAIPVQLHTLLSQDAEGLYARKVLAQAGVTLLITETADPTEQHVNLMDSNGRRISIFAQPPATPGTVDWSAVIRAMAECELAVINILSYARPALAIARECGKSIWTDLHDYDGENPHHQPFIDAADVIFLSSEKLPGYRKLMSSWIARGKQFVVCTHGSDGATLLSSDGQWLKQAAYDAEQAADTNGAGDAFFSGFLASYLRGDSYRECLRSGAACGAMCVKSPSLAAPSLSLDSLNKFAINQDRALSQE